MPKIVDHEERRRVVCDILLDLVAERGISEVSIRSVADAGGWSTGVITHYFKSRQDLLLGGLRRAAEHLDTHNRKALESLEGLNTIEHLLEGSIPIDGRRLGLCRIFVFFYIQAMHDDALRAEVESYLAAWRAAVAKAIRASMSQGDLPQDLDAKTAAMDLIGLADGLSMHALLDPKVMARVRNQSPVRQWIQALARGSDLVAPLRSDSFGASVHPFARRAKT